MKIQKISFILMAILLIPSTSFAVECETGFYYNETVNRCLLKNETVESKTEALACDAKETEEEKKKCYQDTVDKDIADSNLSAAKDGDADTSYTIPAIVSIGAAVYLFGNKEALKGCSSTSMWFLLAGGVGTILGEYLAQNSYKKATKGLASKYANQIQSTETEVDEDGNKKEELTDSERTTRITENQSAAYDFQINQEKARKDAHSDRKKAYQLGMAMYASSAVAATYEALSMQPNSTCTNKSEETKKGPKKETKKTSSLIQSHEMFNQYAYIKDITFPEMVEIVARNIFTLFPKSYAEKGCNEVTETRFDTYGERHEVVVCKEVKKEKDQSDSEQPQTPPPTTETPSGSGGAGAAVGLVAPAVNVGSKLAASSDSATKTAADTAADATDMTPPDGFAEAGKSQKSTMDNAIANPWTRAAIGALLAGYAKKVADKAGKEKKKASARITFLENLKEEFIASGGGTFEVCTKDDRLNPAKVACFCYNEDGTARKSRAQYQSCQGVFDPAPNTNANTYAGYYGPSEGLSGCLTKTQLLDPECGCKKNNSCLVLSGNLNLGPLSSNKTLASSVKDTAGFVSGNVGTGELNPLISERTFASMQKMKEKMMKKATKKQQAGLKKLQDKMKKSIVNNARKTINSGKFNSFQAPGLASSSAIGSKDDPVKKSQRDLKLIAAKTKSFKRRGSKKKNSFDFDFNDGGANNNKIIIEDDIAKVMRKEFNFNDINENSSNSIFKIITNRYHRSGLRELFGGSTNKELIDSPDGVEIHER